MNLLSMSRGMIQAVVPAVPLVVQVSTGETVNGAGKPTPTYAAPVTVQGNIQPISYKDIQILDGLNLQGTRQRIYLYGHIDGLVRVSNKGGDLITDPDGNVWLVALVEEQWPTWVACLATLQNGS